MSRIEGNAMTTDAQGLELIGASQAAAEAFDEGVRAFALSYGDTLGAFDAARQASPGCTMAHIGKAWVFALANDAVLVKNAYPLIEMASGLPATDREHAHLAALGHAVKGHRASATAILDRYLMRHPHDLLAHFAALLLDAFQGRFAYVRDRSARALPQWSKSMPSYGVLLSFYGFGLEEAGQYEKAEDTSRESAALEPYGYWPHHAMSHVLEMTGRPAEGLQWMDSRAAFWSSEKNVSRTHIWWHKALFHVELGQYDKALELYDGPIAATQRPLGISLTNGSALLWRLEMLGYDGGHRWQDLSKLWAGHADGNLCLFADIHAAMTAIRSGDGAELDRLLAGMHASAAGGSEVSSSYRDIALPIVESLIAFDRKAYADAVDKLLASRHHLWRIGGSHAQRDVIDWTLNEAAARAGMKDIAVALANERLAMRPQSEPNRRFLAEAVA